jgi:hypothetical protein
MPDIFHNPVDLYLFVYTPYIEKEYVNLKQHQVIPYEIQQKLQRIPNVLLGELGHLDDIADEDPNYIPSFAHRFRKEIGTSLVQYNSELQTKLKRFFIKMRHNFPELSKENEIRIMNVLDRSKDKWIFILPNPFSLIPPNERID